MSDKPKPITVRILDQDFRIACQPGEEDGLLSAARHLNQHMQELRASGKVIGAERIAIMVALNLTHDLLSLRKTNEETGVTMRKRFNALRERVELALAESNQLEL